MLQINLDYLDSQHALLSNPDILELNRLTYLYDDFQQQTKQPYWTYPFGNNNTSMMSCPKQVSFAHGNISISQQDYWNIRVEL